MTLRPALPADAPALTELYAWHVLNGTGSFEEVPPSAEAMAARLDRVQALGLPWVVAEEDGDGRLLGYAYAAPYHARSAYRFTVEDSVYVAPHAQGRGIGRALLQGVVTGCEGKGLARMVALIGGADNAASIALHRRLDFQPVGVLSGVGYKHGRWLDVVLMQRALGREAR